MNDDLIFTLYSRAETVFSFDEIAQIFPNLTNKSLRDRLHYFVATHKLMRLRQGIYAKHEFNKFEFANKIYTPSYVSLETVLFKAGVIFQVYKTIFLMSYLTRTIKLKDQEIQYRQISFEILTNMNGIRREIGYFVALPERAFLDAVYIYKNYHFDNLGGLNWEKVNEIKKIYKSKIFEKRVEKYFKIYKNN
jgi:hypothetical protein